jgi:hypothetical protein
MDQIEYILFSIIGSGLIILMIVSKIYYRFFKNKNLHSIQFLKKRTCPYCNEKVRKKDMYCKSCGQQISAFNKKELYCINCGKIDDIKYYIAYREFWVTFGLWGLLGIFPGIVYLFSYYDKKICIKCNQYI